MTSRDFCYWAQGFLENIKFQKDYDGTLNIEQVRSFERHLAMVFEHEIDPSFGKDNDILNNIHKTGGDGLIMC